jgi:hypothetical protein
MAHAWVNEVQRELWLWGSLAPSMHTFFCNTVRHGQYVHYRVKSLPLKQLVTLMCLCPLIMTSAQYSHLLWTCLGIQISCISSTVLTVLLLSTALHHSHSYGINILYTLPVRHTSHTKIFSHQAIWHLTAFLLDTHFPDWINMSTAGLWCSLMATGWLTQFICAR